MPYERHPSADLTERVLECAFHVHAALGPGLFESAYRDCLVHRLRQRGLDAHREVPIALRYEGLTLECAYHADILVGSQVLIELKSVERLLPIHHTQALTYLRLSGADAALLLNFNERRLVNGIHRYVPRTTR